MDWCWSKSYDAHTSVDRPTPAWEQHLRPPTKLSRSRRWHRQAAKAALTGRSRQSTKTNKAASDATIEAHVVISFACVEWRGATLSSTGRWLAGYSGAFRRHQSNDRAWRAVHMWHVYNIVQSLGTAIIAKLPIPRSIMQYHLIDMKPRSTETASTIPGLCPLIPTKGSVPGPHLRLPSPRPMTRFVPAKHLKPAITLVRIKCGEEEETTYHLLGRCSAMMMAHYSIFGSYLMDITELQQVQPHTLLRFATALKRFI